MQLLAATLLKAPSGAMLWAATPPPGASVRLQLLLECLFVDRGCDGGVGEHGCVGGHDGA